MQRRLSNQSEINDRLLRSWIKCRRKAWLDKYEDKNKRIWTPHLTLQINNQHESYIELIKKSNNYSQGEFKGSNDYNYGLRLEGISQSGQKIKANPPILKKIQGRSIWGEFAYRPVIAKQGKKVTRENLLNLSLVKYLLNGYQETPLNSGIAVSRKNNLLKLEKVHLSNQLESQLHECINKLNKDLENFEPPPITANRRKCTICCWEKSCSQVATNSNFLSEISGVGVKRMEKLQKNGIKTYSDLANSDPLKIDKIFETYNSDISLKIIKQASAQANNESIHIDVTSSLPELKNSESCFVYDIESDPDERFDFLHGFISIKNTNRYQFKNKKYTYQPILLLEKNNDIILWKRLINKINSHPNWPIIHYGETESLFLRRLAYRLEIPKAEYKEIDKRLVDIHSRLRKHWILPINNYSLKTVCKYIGFEWEIEGSNGAKALLWWRQWLNSKRSKKKHSENLNSIFKYNRDDCLATLAVASWMINQESLS